jgi:2-phospho-L-lactate/phosphoenolpyruvate guanylyltransferase
MNGWTALVPIKQGGGGKSRLSQALSNAHREALSLRMAKHVLTTLGARAEIEEIVIVSAQRPDWWAGAWIADEGRGLNAEITAWRVGHGAGPILVIHADLPLLSADDIGALLGAAARHGATLATDRAGEGSNALAIADRRAFTFRFGPESRRLHAEQDPAMPVIERMGLMADMDTPEDLAFARAHGFTP